jgi:hypothetical protein
MKPKQKRLQKDILFLSISSFIVIVAWIGFNIYHIYVTSTISEDLQLQLTPISPVFDTQTIQKLQSRENINPVFEMQKTISPTPFVPSAPSPTPDVTAQSNPEASGTAQITPISSSISKVGQ